MAEQVQFSPKIIGPGKPGCKTQDLIKFAGLIESLDIKEGGTKLNLSLPKSAAITPSLCRKFEKGAGCNENDNRASAKEKMLNCKSSEFDAAIGEAYQFHHERCRSWPFATRSDDFGATGVLTTSFVWVNTNNTDASQIANIKASTIEVLSSSFSDEAKTMARLFANWGSEGTGVLINPFYGNETEMSFGVTQQVKYGPAFSLAYLAPLEKSDYSVWQVSRGIAMNPAGIQKKVYSTSQEMNLEMAIGVSRFDSLVGLDSGEGWFPRMVLFRPMFEKTIQATAFEKASRMLNAAMAQIGKRGRLYAELVCEGSENIYDWMVLQMSGMEWANFTHPKISFDQHEIRTRRVMGFADKTTEGVHFATYMPDFKMREYNATHKNYLLVVDARLLGYFKENWHIRDYGNAGAIVFTTKDIYNPVLSHVGGVVRMLDIPIIVLEEKYDSDKISKLKAFGENASLRILVDESVPLGGIKKI